MKDKNKKVMRFKGNWTDEDIKLYAELHPRRILIGRGDIEVIECMADYKDKVTVKKLEE